MKDDVLCYPIICFGPENGDLDTVFIVTNYESDKRSEESRVNDDLAGTRSNLTLLLLPFFPFKQLILSAP